jgi:tetratricopeptide (TPR) repeat protein
VSSLVAPISAEASSASQSTDRLSSPLTHVGSIMGTPRYMAPEQHLGDVADARADQFSFCVSMYEALYGTPPFEWASPPRMRDAVLAGTIASPPAGTRVPRWLRLVLLRGLAPEPAARYPSMAALLLEIEKVPARARRRWLIAGALVSMTALGAAGLQSQRSRAVVCKAPESELADVWGVGPRAAVSAAFRRTQAPEVEASLRGTLAALDGAADAWKAMRYDTCAATRVRGEQSEAMLDLRMECLAQRRTELGAVVSLLSRADASLVARGRATVEGLSDLAICANTRALRAPVRPPGDAVTQAKVADLRNRLASSHALFTAAKYAEALKVIKPLAAEAMALKYLPLQSEVLYMRGRIEARLGDAKASEGTFREVLATAVESGHDEMAARATDALSGIACDATRLNEALLWGRLAQSFVNRVGIEGIEDNIQIGLGNVYEVQGHYAEAQAAYERALEIRLKSKPDDAWLGHPLLGLGLVLFDQARWAEALATYQRGLAVQEKSLPPGHPDIGMTLTNIAETLMRLKRLDEAKAAAERARAIFEKALGADHPYVIAAREMLVVIELANGDYSALPRMRALVTRMDQAFGADTPDGAVTHVVFGEALRKAGQPAAALVEQQHAVAVLEKALDARHPRLAEPLVALGRAALDLRRTKLAVDSLERALEIGIADPLLKGEARAALDHALRATP